MNDIKKDTKQCGLAYAKCESVWCDSAGDFTLPDYMPEIGKMLSCTPRLIPAGKYIGSDRAEFSGSIVYSVIYTGDDGIPFYTTLSGEYEYAVPLGSAAESSRIEIYDEPSVESVNIRASGPRKISVRSRIKARPCIAYEASEPTEDETLFGDQNCQRLTETRTVSSRRHFESGEFTVSEMFKLDSSPDAEPVGCDGVIYVTDTVKTASSVICRGEVECRVLYYDIEGGRRKLFCTKKKIRFEHEVPISELGSVTGVRAYGRVISTDIAVSDNSNEISVTATATLLGEYTAERKLKLLRDVYFCDNSCNVQYENTEFSRGVLCRNMNISCRAEKELSESQREYAVCTSQATPKVSSVSVTDGKAELAGEITVECLLSGEDGDGMDYSSLSLVVPFKAEAPVSAMTGKYDVSVIPDVAGVRTRIEKEKLFLDAELYLSVLIEGTEGVSTVKSVTPEAPISREINGVTVYYPDGGETLWSVSKKYSAPLSRVARINGLSVDSPDSPESLDDVKFILIA